MSSPIRKILSSRSISSSRASRSACRISFSAIEQPLGLLAVEEPVELLDRRVGALVREPDDLVDLVLDLFPDLLEVLLGGDLRLLHLVLEADDRVGLQ